MFFKDPSFLLVPANCEAQLSTEEGVGLYRELTFRDWKTPPGSPRPATRVGRPYRFALHACYDARIVMRPIKKPFMRFASLTLLAALGGCSGGTQPDAGDATGTDTMITDGGTQQDTAPQMDAAPPTDSSELVDAVPGDGFTPGSCTISPAVAEHINMLATMGWSAQNRSRGMMMWDCAEARTPRECLASVPEADDSNIGTNRSAVSGARLRVLYSSTNASHYWTRSSVDGRFVGRGTHLHDLSRRVEIEAIGAMFDPAFFPDNSGFMYQPGGRLCPMSVLTIGMPTSVSINNVCAGSSVGLYEHLGASLSGGDYWATSAGTAAWDDGGHRPTTTETRRNENWGPTASTTLTLMANTGSGFMAVGQRNVMTPYQGDAVISPSSTMMITRFVDEAGTYQGYVLHRLEATHMGAAITARTTEIARYCTVGAKPAFSLDERYVVYHHYIGTGPAADADARDLGFTGASDSRFEMYISRGAANIYLLDLVTGTRTRLTNMAPGQYALYPHFRNDGWIYFLVRTLGTMQEYMIATDAALVLGMR